MSASSHDVDAPVCTALMGHQRTYADRPGIIC